MSKEATIIVERRVDSKESRAFWENIDRMTHDAHKNPKLWKEVPGPCPVPDCRWCAQEAHMKPCITCQGSGWV